MKIVDGFCMRKLSWFNDQMDVGASRCYKSKRRERWLLTTQLTVSSRQQPDI